MAKKLPSPEDYGRRMAERKRKADRVPLILQKLDTLAVGLAEQAETVGSLPIRDILAAVDEMRADIQGLDSLRELQSLTGEAERILTAIGELQDGMIAGLNALSEAILAMPKSPQPATPTNLEPLMQEIRGYRLDVATPVPETAAVVPLAYEFDAITRDENGDITGARVIPVTRH